MTTASTQTFTKTRSTRKVSLNTVVEYMESAKASTVHDAAKVLGQRLDAGDVQESGQFWAEIVSRFGEAAKKGYLDDSETIQTDTGSYRTVYKFNAVRQAERMSGPERLRARIAELEAQLKELNTKYTCACDTIDKLTGAGNNGCV